GNFRLERVLASEVLGVTPVVPGGRLALSAPWPNPARDALSLRVTLPDDAPARLALYDVAGREQRCIALHGAGEQTVRVDGLATLPAGLYFARVSHRSGERVVRVAVTR